MGNGKYLLLLFFIFLVATNPPVIGSISSRSLGKLSLVKDINKSGNSNPQSLTRINTALFFTAYSEQGRGLWKTDGTTSGTELLKIIDPETSNDRRLDITNVNGTLFFSVYDPLSGYQLWKTDGTQSGTSFVKKVRVYSFIVNSNSKAFFTSGNSGTGLELWVSDGTDVGTKLIKDIWRGQFSSKPSNLTDVNGTLFFAARDQVSGRELWRSDGTLEGTLRVRNISPGASHSDPTHLKNVNGTLFFTSGGLWKSDGTSIGTKLVKDVTAAVELTTVRNLLAFSAMSADEPFNDRFLWRTDGTTNGTILIKSNVPNEKGPLGTHNLSAIGRTLFFAAYSSNFESNIDVELWRSDLTNESTVLVKNINAGGSSHPNHFTDYNGIVFFNATTNQYGDELWQTDGTERGTFMIKDIFPGANSSEPRQLTVSNGILFFTATHPTKGTELWKYEFD